MDSMRNLVFVLIAFISISPAFVSAQSNGPTGGGGNFIASPLYKSEGPVYALAGGEFDLTHDGLEIACLTSSGSVIQLSPNYLTWEAAVRFQGINPILDMSTRPTIGIGDVHSNDRLFGVRSADRFKDAIDDMATSRGVDDQISRQGFAFPVAVLDADGRNRSPVGRGRDVQRAAVLADGDVFALSYVLSHSQLDQRP